MEGFGDKARLFTAEIDFHKLGQPQEGDSADDKDVDAISNGNEANQHPSAGPSSHPRFSTRLAAALKREAGVGSSSPIEATSSKTQLTGKSKVPKAEE